MNDLNDIVSLVKGGKDKTKNIDWWSWACSSCLMGFYILMNFTWIVFMAIFAFANPDAALEGRT